MNLWKVRSRKWNRKNLLEAPVVIILRNCKRTLIEKEKAFPCVGTAVYGDTTTDEI
jgi:hypothetical protein